jgi:hypothetical protein
MSLFIWESKTDGLTTSTDEYRGNQSGRHTIRDLRVKQPNYTPEQIAERLLQAGEKRAATMLKKKQQNGL